MVDDVDIDDTACDAATARGRIETESRAVSARQDREADRIEIELGNGCTFLFPPSIAQDLRDATPDQLADVAVSPAGSALHWPGVDVDFSVAGLVAGIFDTATFMEAQRRHSCPA